MARHMLLANGSSVNQTTDATSVPTPNQDEMMYAVLAASTSAPFTVSPSITSCLGYTSLFYDRSWKLLCSSSPFVFISSSLRNIRGINTFSPFYCLCCK